MIGRNYIINLIGLVFLLIPYIGHSLGMVEDTIPPNIVIPPSDRSLPCNTSADKEAELTLWYNSYGGMVAQDDNSDTIIYSAVPDLETAILNFNSSSGCGNEKSVAVQFIATDDCGNSSQGVTGFFRIEDNINPRITRQASPLSLPCTAGIRDSLNFWVNDHGGALAEDDCSTIDWLRFTFSDNLNNTGVGFIGLNNIPMPDGICDWKVNVSFIVVDECGNQGVTTSYFQVMDTIPPELINLPPDTIVGCESLPFINDVEALDHCTSDPQVIYSEEIIREGNPGDCSYYNYIIIRNWEAIDNCGNTTSHTQTVSIIDTIAPTFSLVDTVMVSCEEIDDPDAAFLPSGVMDDCSEVTIEISDNISGDGCNYSIDRNYTFSDACGNTSTATQHIIVSDLTPPSFIVRPTDNIYLCNAQNPESFQSWINNFGEGVVKDNCGEMFSFTAVPGSYNIDDPSTFPGVHPDALDNQGCGNAEKGYLFYEVVDFVVYDDCGNADVRTAVYGILDDTPPVITGCLDDMTIEADSGMCAVLFTLPNIKVQDNCVESVDTIIKTVTAPIHSGDPGNEDIIVEAIRLSFSGYKSAFLDIAGNGKLKIEVFQADINNPGEHFLMISERGDTLGTTGNSIAQCDNATFYFDLDQEDLSEWVSNGNIDIFMIPLQYENGSEGINDICTGADVKATLSFPSGNADVFDREVLVDNLSMPKSNNPDNNLLLDIGTHTIDYIVRDCGGNTDTCSFEVTVVDKEGPSIVCPPDSMVFLNPDSCAAYLELPADFLAMDNCSLNKKYDRLLPVTNEGSLLNFIYDEERQEYLAQNVLLRFTENFPIKHAPMDGVLEISILADVSTFSQFIEIYGEDGTSLGRLDSTNVSACSVTQLSFVVPRSKINSWGSDGIIEISFIPSSTGDGNGQGITPCSDINADGPDGKSFITGRLKYSDALFKMEVSGASSIPETGFQDLDMISFSANHGTSTIVLTVQDIGGNESSCSFSVEVSDITPPKANCQNAVVFLDPSGVNDLVLDPDEIDNLSSDNCGIDSMAVSPSVFNCSQLGEEIDIQLMVWDKSRNSDSCTATIQLRTEVLQPGFEIGICDNDTLRLLANVPDSDVEDVFSYLWTGPDFTSVLENPVIVNATPENNGTYFLEITGFNGCISTGTVEVNVEQLSSPVITTEVTEICIGDPLLLSAAGQTGDITYNWYEGTYPNGLLLESTDAPSLQLVPSPGDHFYYLIVDKDGCLSNPSPSTLISVINPPVATVIDEFVTVCRGEPLVFGTDVSGAGLEYYWTGPRGYTSSKQFPDTIYNTASSNEGIYKLVISLGSCSSDTASLQVTLFEKPGMPEIIAGDVYCEGTSISLSVNNIPNADLYTWFRDGLQVSATTRNTLVLNNASEELSGKWTVEVTEGQCLSDMSLEKDITVESELLISANNNGPGCEGDSIQLSVSFVPGANYLWSGPQGFSSKLQNPRILSVEGDYFVTVTTPSGCDGESSTLVEVISPPSITALSTDALECMDGMTDISLFPSIFPQGEYQYQWKGPADFSSTSINPVIQDVTEDNNGIYTLVVSNGKCLSEERGIVVDITVIPNKPSVNGKADYCVDDTLKLTAVAPTDGNRFLWSTPQGQRFTEGPDLIIPFIEKDDIGAYTVAVQRGVCRSAFSEPIEVGVGSLPFAPSIEGAGHVCPGDSIKLFATTFRNALYSWTGPNGFSSNTQNPVIPDAGNEDEGSYVVTVTQGSCTVSSPPFAVSLYAQPAVPVIDNDEYIICETALEGGIEICIAESNPVSGISYLIYDDNTLLSESNTLCQVVENLTGFSEGSNIIYLIAEGEQCVSEKSAPINIRVSSPPLIDAEAEINPVYVCNTDPVRVVSLFGSPEVEVNWSSPQSNLLIGNVSGRETEVSNLQPGNNHVVLTYSNGACIDFTRDTVLIVLEETARARNDNYVLPSTGEILLDVFDNDIFPASAGVKIVKETEFGQLEVLDNGILYKSSPAYIGMQSFIYEVCVPSCQETCSRATVNLIIGDPGDCVAPTIFTPNGDNINDAFIVPCLFSGNYPDSRLQVYNQWGSIVFEAENYDNTWEGTYNGDPLPVGTYYYVLRLDARADKIIGFLILER